MFWCDQLLEKVAGPQVINDSKTPSGRAHVGALRGVLIHDAIYRTLRERGTPVRYQFGVDDYDPLDELPAGQGEHFEKHLGAPLFTVPPPPGSKATDMADHYFSEFLEVFKELGVFPEIYRMRDVYRSGRFNEAIEMILNQAATVRRIYKEISHSDRPAHWHPFQAICESCGRLGTTEVSAFDGKEVTYTCRPDLVKWARGCGYQGKVSPFDGRGKLPWKLEWTAKWKTMGITIEGGGQDHNTKGGSRDTAVHCLRAIFGQEPPLNVPYEFFLVDGAKMSSSRGVGVSSREMADFLPPEVLRFLMIRTKPNNHVNFSPSETHIIKLFNEIDRYHRRAFHDAGVSAEDKRVYFLSEVAPEGDYFDAEFQLVVTLLQMPHLDVFREMEKRKRAPLTAIELKHLNRRIQAAKYWLDRYAQPEEKTQLQMTLPSRAAELTATQRAFLSRLADLLVETTPWQDDVIQSTIFSAARLTPIAQPTAFQAIYRVLLDRESGPKAGNLLSFLDREFVIKRAREVAFDRVTFWNETAVSLSDFEAWLTKERASIAAGAAEFHFAPLGNDPAGRSLDPNRAHGIGAMEFTVTFTDGKIHLRRVLVGPLKEADPSGAAAREDLEAEALRCFANLPKEVQWAVKEP